MAARTTRRTTTSRRRESAQNTARAVDCVRRLVNALGESARAVEQHTGVTNAQLFLLRQLQREDVLTINELAARSLTQQSTVSLLVQRLEQAGLVDRERSAADARRVCVTLTAKGKRIVERAPEPPMARMLRGLDSMRGEDIDALVQGVGALLTVMRVPSKARPLFEPTAVRAAELRPKRSNDGAPRKKASGAR